MFDDVISLPAARFRLHSDDPTFHVQWRGGARFRLSGEVSADPQAQMELDTPSSHVEIDLPTGSKPEHAIARLRRELPRDVRLEQLPGLDGVDVRLTEMTLPAAKLPRLRLFSSDSSQRIKQLDENRVEFLGAVGTDGLLTILCDTKRTTIAVPHGCSAQATAARVGASMPSGYRALVDGPVVSVWKDADFFEMVA